MNLLGVKTETSGQTSVEKSQIRDLCDTVKLLSQA
jgi:hypothetical protein